MRAPDAWSLEHGMMVRRFGAGPEIVWIHGLGDWSVSYDPIVQHPAFAGFLHTLPDLPGYGRSPWPAELSAGDSLEGLAAQLAAWLAPRPPAILIGHSMGGVLATLVAERVPVRGVVNIDGNLSRGDCSFSARAAASPLEELVDHGFADLRAEIAAEAERDPALLGYHAALCAASPAVFYQNSVDLVRLSSTETLARRLVALRCPSLFVAAIPHGPCERSRTLLEQAGARWVSCGPAGHWIYLDQPAAFADVVRPFLASCARRAARAGRRSPTVPAHDSDKGPRDRQRKPARRGGKRVQEQGAAGGPRRRGVQPRRKRSRRGVQPRRGGGRQAHHRPGLRDARVGPLRRRKRRVPRRQYQRPAG
jgi:pimeloyl-ACP methyl ester carboxylesterase